MAMREYNFTLIFKTPRHQFDRFAHALENSSAPLAATARGGSPGVVRLLFRPRDESGLSPLFEPVAFAADVHRGRMVQQAIEDRGSDDRVAEDRAPFAVALVGSQNDAAPLLTGADQLKEDRRAELVQRQISHFVDDEDVGGKIEPQPSVEASSTVGTPEVG